MTTLTDISAGANRDLVACQVLWSTRKNAAGAVAGFGVDVDRIVTRVHLKMDNLAASTGTSVTSAKSALTTLANAAKAAAVSAGTVEPPAAA
jgi:hypothetical protein